MQLESVVPGVVPFRPGLGGVREEGLDAGLMGGATEGWLEGGGPTSGSTGPLFFLQRGRQLNTKQQVRKITKMKAIRNSNRYLMVA